MFFFNLQWQFSSSGVFQLAKAVTRPLGTFCFNKKNILNRNFCSDKSNCSRQSVIDIHNFSHLFLSQTFEKKTSFTG